MKMIILALTLMLSLSAQALNVPTLNSPVMDQANILAPEDKAKLEQEIRNIWDKKLVQISILIIPSLEGEVIEDYSMKVAEKWKLGNQKEDNGVLILVAIKEKKIRLEVGNGIEGTVTDSRARRFVDAMGPYMRQGQVYQALSKTCADVQTLMEQNTPEAKAEQEAARVKAEVERAQSMQALANFFVWVLNGFLVILGLYYCYYAAFASKEEAKTLLKEEQELIEREQKEEKDQKSTAEKLKSVQVDYKKQEYISQVEYLDSLKSEESRLSSSIAAMKKYLGRS